MKLSHIQYFVAAADAGSLNKAAQSLYVSQPHLSNCIKQFEQEIGKTLIKRSNNGISLTIEGEAIYKDAVKILKIVHSWRSSPQLSGDIHVCVFPPAGHLVSSYCLIPFVSQYPDIHVFIHDVRPQNVMEILKNTKSNIALVSAKPELINSINNDTAHTWNAELLYTDERKLLISSTHVLANKEELSKEDLKTLDIVYYSLPQDEISEEYHQFFRNSIRLARREDILDVVAQGSAVCIMPARLSQISDRSVINGEIIQKSIPLAEVNVKADIYLIYSKKLSPAESLFARHLKTIFLKYINVRE